MDTIIKIPYTVFNNDWDLLQQFLERKGNPRYELTGDVNLYQRKDIFNLGNLVRVYGDLRLFGSSIQSLGNLEYVGGYLDLEGTPIQSLGNLEHVGGTIYLSYDHQIPEEQLTKFKIKYV